MTFYSLATAQGFQRLTASAHWASDVFIGAVSGVAAARYIIGRYEPSPESDSGLSFGPAPLPTGDGIGWGATRGF